MKQAEKQTSDTGPSTPAGFAGWFGEHLWLSLSLFAPVICILAVLLFYQEENWRGKRAWDNYKREAKANGRELDWEAFIPPPVADEKNFFAAPDMQSWFVGRGGNSFNNQVSFNNFGKSQQGSANCVVAEVTIVPPTAAVASNEAEIVLRYNYPRLTESAGPDAARPQPEPETPMPLIVMDEVPLTDAIKNLTHQANIKYTFDPKIDYGQPDAAGVVHAQPTVSLRWTNVTATAALTNVLGGYGLTMVRDASSDVARIVKLNEVVHKPPVLEVELAKMIGDALAAASDSSPSNDARSPLLTASLGFQLAARPLSAIKPVQVFIRSDTIPTTQEVKDFFPQHTFGNISSVQSRLEALPSGSNTFHIYLNPPPVVAAGDYLEWSDQLQPDFDKIGAALQRPYALMNGGYDDPITQPVPNFVSVRMMAQTLSQRAQCHLLLGQPEKALSDLTLLHNMGRLLEGRPTGRPMTLVAAMINVAVTGIYVSVIADGVRLQVWREPELAALQQQLAEVDLESHVAGALQTEPASQCRILESRTPEELLHVFNNGSVPATPQDKMKDPIYLFLAFAPRGWIYQNAVRCGELEMGSLDGFDVAHHLIEPLKEDAHTREVMRVLDHPTPYLMLCTQMIPNLSRAVKNMAKTQTLVNEGMVVCALERYRMANGQYPAALDALTPKFADKLPVDMIGGQALRYRTETNGFTLYSVGWNMRDDGGVPCWKRDGSGDSDTNDWVWPYR